ncbi:MAG: ferredoxin--NADP reductase [Phycisphaerae bacterium]|jgi:ferredoxin--NADP+ reductase
MSADPLNATLIERHDLNEMLSIVRVRPDSGRVPDFTPGQFITLGLPKEIPAEVAAIRPRRPGRTPMTRRAYSIASPPGETEAYELFVVLVTEGKLTPKMWTLSEGDRLWMDEVAKGEFTLERVPAGQDLVLISTGTGIAPFMSMLRHYRGTGRWRRVVLINGVRRVSDLGYRAELEAICREDASVRHVPVVSREGKADGWDGLHGRVPAVLEPETYERLVGSPLDPASCQVCLCGNPGMIDDVEALLHERGFRTQTDDQPGNIHVERYW